MFTNPKFNPNIVLINDTAEIRNAKQLQIVVLHFLITLPAEFSKKLPVPYPLMYSVLQIRIRMDPHQSDKLDPDPDPHQFADDKPKCKENGI
jgi:hypothetical protein